MPNLAQSAAAAFLRGDRSQTIIIDLLWQAFPDASSERDLALRAESVLGLDMRTIQRVLRREQELRSAKHLFALIALVGVEYALDRIFGATK